MTRGSVSGEDIRIHCAGINNQPRVGILAILLLLMLAGVNKFPGDLAVGGMESAVTRQAVHACFPSWFACLLTPSVPRRQRHRPWNSMIPVLWPGVERNRLHPFWLAPRAPGLSPLFRGPRGPRLVECY